MPVVKVKLGKLGGKATSLVEAADRPRRVNPPPDGWIRDPDGGPHDLVNPDTGSRIIWSFDPNRLGRIRVAKAKSLVRVRLGA